MNFKRAFRKLSLIQKSIKYILGGASSFSFSQAGEDKVILFLLKYLDVKNVSYLDIGSNHPVNDNNTYLFYLKGYRGVLVDPNFECKKITAQKRPRDKFLNIGISPDSTEQVQDYYVFSESGINTFSKKDAEHWEKIGMKGIGLLPIKEVRKVKVRNINNVISENFSSSPDIISLDVEGLDLHILKQLKWEIYKPFVICVETLRYDDKGISFKDKEIAKFLETVGYLQYADTYINSIFVHKESFNLKNKI